MDYVLQTNALTKQYKNFKALDNVTMNVPKGSIYGFVGRNGAGKTTLIRIICGIQHQTHGEFTLFGSKKHSDARKRIGAVVETPAIYTDMTARENLIHQYRILGIPSNDGIDEILQIVRLADAGSKKTKNFSLGMRQRLGIAIALCGNPDFLILDEPINGLDPQGIIEIRELIIRLNRERGITVIISSHILDELSKLATHYGFIDQGRIIKEISAEQLEKECRKCIRVTVTDINAFSCVMDEKKVDYSVVSDSEAEIYGKISFTELFKSLLARNCEIISITEKDESLESYFIDLVGGLK